MFMLIDTRQPPPWPLSDGERPPVDVNWRMWRRLAAAVVLFAVSLAQAPLVGSLLLVVAFAFAMRALAAALDRCDGLRAHRQ